MERHALVVTAKIPIWSRPAPNEYPLIRRLHWPMRSATPIVLSTIWTTATSCQFDSTITRELSGHAAEIGASMTMSKPAPVSASLLLVICADVLMWASSCTLSSRVGEAKSNGECLCDAGSGMTRSVGVERRSPLMDGVVIDSAFVIRDPSVTDWCAGDGDLARGRIQGQVVSLLTGAPIALATVWMLRGGHRTDGELITFSDVVAGFDTSDKNGFVHLTLPPSEFVSLGVRAAGFRGVSVPIVAATATGTYCRKVSCSRPRGAICGNQP